MFQYQLQHTRLIRNAICQTIEKSMVFFPLPFFLSIWAILNVESVSARCVVASCPSDKWFKLIIHYAKEKFLPVVWCCCCFCWDLITGPIELPINQLTLIVKHHFDLNLTNYIVNILWQICYDAIKIYS